MIGTCLAEGRGSEPKRTKEEYKGKDKTKEGKAEEGPEGEIGESEEVKEEDEEESGETSMTETAMGTRVPRERPGDSQEEYKPAEGEVEETEKGYEEAKKETKNKKK